jgi:hypothetical protein
VCSLERPQLDRRGRAGSRDVRAAIGEPAAGDLRSDRRRLPGDDLERSMLAVAERRDAQERLGVGVSRVVDDLVDRARLDDLAGVEDDDPVAQLGDDREVARSRS